MLLLPCLPLPVLWLLFRWLRSVHNSGETDCTRQSSASPVSSAKVLEGWIIRLKLLISGGVERRLHLDLTVFKGQGH